MKVTIGSDVYDWDGEYTYQDAVAIEKVLRRLDLPIKSMGEWLDALTPPKDKKARASWNPPMTNLGIFLWNVARRAKPDLKFEDFNYPLDQWGIEDDGAAVDPTAPTSSDDGSTA